MKNERGFTANGVGEKLLAVLRQRAVATPSGGRFPSVRSLMKEFGVSALVVGKALSALQREGLVRSIVGSGTIVLPKAARKTLLWVCGMDLFHGDISPYYTQQLRFVKIGCEQRGLALETAWLSNMRPEDAKPYCSDELLERYAGFFFSGCDPTHPLKRFVMRRTRTAAVAVTVWPPRAHEVSVDFPLAIDLGLAALKDRGHAEITLITPRYEADVTAMIRGVAARRGVDLRCRCYPYQQWSLAYQTEGYRLTLELLAADGLTAGLFFTDDVVAQGATRALLEKCPHERLRALDIVVAGARQAIMPLGMPVLHVVFDVGEMVARAMEHLMNRIEGRTDAPDTHGLPSVLIADRPEDPATEETQGNDQVW